eukprot:SAG22_NODE_3928_length_1464_cov_170.958242_2_plen_84_part_00
MNLLDLNNDILGIIQHKLFLKRLMEHRSKFKFDIDLEDLDRSTNRDGYYFADHFLMPFYGKNGNVWRHKCMHKWSLKYLKVNN